MSKCRLLHHWMTVGSPYGDGEYGWVEQKCERCGKEREKTTWQRV